MFASYKISAYYDMTLDCSCPMFNDILITPINHVQCPVWTGVDSGHC